MHYWRPGREHEWSKFKVNDMVQKKNLVFVDAINYECKDSCTTNFESGEENLNELASYIESPTELKLIVNV